MKRLVLKKGFSLQRTPEGATHLVDGRTGDALQLAPADFEALASAMKTGGLDPEARGPASLTWRFAPFLTLTTELETRSFYELDLGDAPSEPTLPAIPAIAPVTKPVPAVARTTTGSIPSFHELAARTSPPPIARTPTGSIPAVAPVHGGFSAVPPQEPKTSAPEGWSLLPVTTPDAPSPAPAAPPPGLPDDWSVAAALPEREPEVSTGGPRLAEAVSPLLPSIDELIGQALPGVSAVESTDSSPGSRTSPSPVPAAPALEVEPVLGQLEAPHAVPPPRASPVPSIAPVVAHEALPEPLPPEAPRRTSSAEQELRDALAAAAQQPAPATMPDDEPLPTAELLPLDAPLEDAPLATLEPLPEAEPVAAPTGAEAYRSQEENLRAALEQTAPGPEGKSEVQAFLADTAKQLEPSPAAPPSPRDEAPLPSSKKPMVLTFVGVTLLVLGVSASMMLKPGGDAKTPDVVPPPRPVVTAAVDAAVPPPPTPVPAEPVVDAAVVAPTPTPAPVVDAGGPAPTPEVDAGAPTTPPTPGASSFVAEVIGRGRVKMGDVTAPAEGPVTWAVEPEQRVKSKQVLGTVGPEGAQKNLTAPSVGLAMLKVESGATAKKGAVLAEIIYFEAWAKALVKGAVPTPTWACEVLSEAAGQRAPCKISVVTPKAGGAQVTVAIEPRWFDGATDAVLRVAPE